MLLEVGALVSHRQINPKKRIKREKQNEEAKGAQMSRKTQTKGRKSIKSATPAGLANSTNKYIYNNRLKKNISVVGL